MMGRRRAVALVVACMVVVGVSACATGPKQRQVAATVAHLEYVPATTHVEQECTGAVPMVCSERTVLEKQCWRVDVQTTFEFLAETGYDGQARYHERGDLYNEIEAVCVFPSEFKQLSVGDPWVPPAVPYEPGPVRR